MTNAPADSAPAESFLVRHEFLIRRLHSLSGLIPVGAYMVVHLLTNASVLAGPAAFQANVYKIHSLGPALPFVEWGFIFLPLIFHAVIGFVIIGGGLSNTGNYPWARNYRYTLQRATGMIAALFILWHVFHMHGWFHFAWWMDHVATPLDGARFKPYNAASTAGAALQGLIVPALYTIGILASTYHLANGIWTMGITWGVWISPKAQQRATWACLGFGLFIGAVGLAALFGMREAATASRIESTLMIENTMYREKTASYEVTPSPGKRLDSEQQTELIERLDGEPSAAAIDAPGAAP